MRNRPAMRPIRVRTLFAALLTVPALLAAGQARAGVWYVDKASTASSPNGTSWASAFPTLQAGIDAAALDTDQVREVWVRAGVYDEQRVSFFPAANSGSVIMRTNVAIYGGFGGGETARNQRDVHRNRTVIDGSRSLSGQPAEHVVLGANGVLDGFTITGGRAADANDVSGYGGGLISTSGAAPLVANCTFEGNRAFLGGAVYHDGFNLLLLNCRFTNNEATALGGGLYINGAAAALINCIVDDNRTVDDLLPADQLAGGGLIVNGNASLQVWHSVFWNNDSPVAATVGVINGTAAPTTKTFRNSILWHPSDPGIAVSNATNPSIQFSIVRGGFTGTGNLNVDPQLAAPGRGDFTPRVGSPAVDAGTSQGRPAGAEVDYFINARPLRGGPDIGAVELPEIFYVDNSVVRTNPNGRSWANAFNTIQAAIDAASNADGGEVWIARGVYAENRSAASPVTGALRMRAGVDVYGEFAGYEDARSERILPDTLETVLFETVIEGATARGGQRAIHVVVGADDAILDGVRIAGGQARGATPDDTRGGGVFNTSSGFVLRNAQVTFNDAVEGGGIYWAANGVIDSVLVRFGTAGIGGGILFGGNNAPRLTNSVIVENTATGDGGGIHARSADPLILHSVIYRNTAGNGGGVFAQPGANVLVANSIVRGNAPDQYDETGSGDVAVRRSNVQQSGGSNVINQNPLFYAADAPYDFRLRIDSPSMDASAARDADARDARGIARIQRAAPDHGAYEMRPVVFVNRANNNTVRDGTTWARALRTIQGGIDAAAELGEADVWVAQGTYDEDRDSLIDGVNTASVVMRPGVHLFGGFAANDTALVQRNIAARLTVITGDGVRGAADALHVVVGANNATLDGFTIRNGATANSGVHRDGAGLWNRTASPVVWNCTFALNAANRLGGGVHNFGANPLFVNSVFRGNSAGDGGAMANAESSVRLVHCTLAGNSGTPGAFFNTNSRLRVVNSVLWNNGASATQNTNATAVFRFSGVQGGVSGAGNSGTGNIDANPLFVNEGQGNLRLQASSPAVNAASRQAIVYFDHDRVQRPQAAAVDMGAFEALDSDGDGILDGFEGSDDPDGDGIPNYLDTDSDGDGIPDNVEGTTDSDGDGTSDLLDTDSDNNTIPDAEEGTADLDGDGVPNYRDPDNDGDGLTDLAEITVHMTSPYLADSDGGGVSDGGEVARGTNPNDPADDFEGIDVNGDGQLNAIDVQLTINGALGLPIEGDADVNDDGSVNAVDVQLIINAVLLAK